MKATGLGRQLSGAALLALAAWAVPTDATAADSIAALVSGPAVVLDGSHLEVAGRRFKLYGVDAPDIDQTCGDAQGKDYSCGIEARDALRNFAKSGATSCLPRGPNQNDEALAACSAGTTDLARAMIDAGWAVADRARTLFYEAAEEKTRGTKQGLWQGPFVPPAAWRIGERVPQRHFGVKGGAPQKLF